jgi:hypothetical protein
MTFTIRATRDGKPRVRENVASEWQAGIIAAAWHREGWREITINGERWMPEP